MSREHSRVSPLGLVLAVVLIVLGVLYYQQVLDFFGHIMQRIPNIFRKL